MNELERWGQRPTSIVPTREERAQGKEMAGIAHAARAAALRVDAVAAVTSRVMDRAAALDAQRLALANGSPELNAVLMRIEVGFAANAERLQQEATGQGFRL